MSELENEDLSSEANEETTSSEESETSSESNTDSEKSKKFDVWKEYKKLKKENRVLKASVDDEDSDEELEAQQAEKNNDSFDDVKFDIFLLRNKEAEEYEEEIKETLGKFPNMSFSEAYSFSKANYTKSQTSKNFSTKSATPKKELKELSKEEVLAMKDSKKLLEWSRLNGQIR